MFVEIADGLNHIVFNALEHGRGKRPRSGLNTFANVIEHDGTVRFAQPRGQFPTESFQLGRLAGLVQR